VDGVGHYASAAETLPQDVIYDNAVMSFYGLRLTEAKTVNQGMV
jgi:hypothetical protein